METTNYPPPVDKLLTYGDGRKVGRHNWSQYLELGFGPEHIPDLIRMATDQELHRADSDSLEVWAPLHAWRVLGQLRAEAAIEPLLSRFEVPRDEENYWEMEELPQVYGMIGPAAIPALRTYLADESHEMWARVIAANCLAKVGDMHPDARSECIAILSQQLEPFEENDPLLNALLISYLIDLHAQEAAPIIERAFAAECVDLMVAGDWGDVQAELGLASPAETLEWRMKNERLKSRLQAILDEEREEKRTLLGTSFWTTPGSHISTHKKAKHKMSKQSRKKNRRRK